jgi:hypothetical protein
MDLDRIACGNCGANLDVPDGVQFVTCRHCGSSLKVQRSNDVAFTEVLQSLKEHSARIADNTDALRLQNEIALLDQEWEQRSADLMLRGKHGRVSSPDKASAVVGGVVITIFGLVWTAIAGMMFPPMAILGLLFVAFGLWNSVTAFDKAGRYQALQAEHDHKREDLLSRLQSLENERR